MSTVTRALPESIHEWVVYPHRGPNIVCRWCDEVVSVAPRVGFVRTWMLLLLPSF